MIEKVKNTPSSEDALDSLRREMDELTARVAALSSLIEVGMIISSARRLDEVLRLVMQKAHKVMGAEACSILIINETKKVFQIPVALGEASEKFKTIEIPMDAGIAGWVVKHGQPQIIPDAYKDPRFNPSVDEETGFVTRSILAAPLMVRDKLIGVAEVINRTDGKPFNEEDLDLFLAFCRQVALAIENARIHELELEQQRLEQQLEAAKFIQESFLPESFPVSAEKKFSVAAKSMPAASVGGDIYDFVTFDDDTLGISVGDVSGKGIPAALFMARLVSDFRLYSQIYPAPEKLLKTLNKAIAERSRRGMFITFTYGVLDAEAGLFQYASAGHLPLIRFSPGSDTIDIPEAGPGIPLGISPAASFSQQTLQLYPNDCLIMVTDGVVEAKNSEGEAYSFERLKKTIITAEAKTCEGILDAIIDDLQLFSKDASQHDDITIVVLKWQ